MREAIVPQLDEVPVEELDYHYYHLPDCRIAFRGPLQSFDAPFVAVLGGTEAFGKYVACPFSDLVADLTGRTVVNLGVAQAGLSLFSEEQVLLDLASKADVTVLQILGAQNMSNRLYSVHSRRNDRFLSVSPALRELYPTVEFTDIHFTGHLLSTLRRTSEAAFAVVVEELKWAWTQRMRRVLSLIDSEVILLWLPDRKLSKTSDSLDEEEPRFVDWSMIEELEGSFAHLVEVAMPPDRSLDGKLYPAQEEEAARLLPGPAVHRCIADAIAPLITELGNNPGRKRGATRVSRQSFSINSGTAVNKSATSP